MIEIQNIEKTYKVGPSPVIVLQDISLHIQAGEFVSIMGASGSGKSTLLNILGCFDKPDTGSYFLDSKLITYENDSTLSLIRNKKIGFIFQSFNLIPHYNALQNIELPLIYSGVNPDERKKRCLDLLKKVGLHDRAEHLPNALSGGERQRVAIARALIGNQTVILADEPTGNLDTSTSEEIMALLKTIHQSGTTLVLVTHDPKIAQQTQRVIHISDGQILSDSPV
jgi:putative ABC transport system ATP-binding protein